MTIEDKELLLKDLCARLPYGVKGLHKGEVQRLLLLDYSFGSYQVNGYYDAWFSLDSVDFKPYLRPMSSMTEEEEKTFSAFLDYQAEYVSDTDLDNKTDMFDWLNENHFDYRGLIEKGLALEAPEDMYKAK